MGRSRNAACPCGSGRKYKRCCHEAELRAKRRARDEDAAGRRIQEWAARVFADELTAALETFTGPDRTLTDADVQLFATWFHNDRELLGGGTPAQRYAGRSDLPAPEREAARRIADGRLGLYRVCGVQAGRSLVLEDIVRGTMVRVYSHTVSAEAVRWDILLARVIDGDLPSLWGPVRVFAPHEELELLAELERLAGGHPEHLDETQLSRAFREHALELTRFMSPSSCAEPSFFTLEGDPVARGSAAFTLRDRSAAAKRLRALGGLPAGDPLQIDITMPRAELVRRRGHLPLGAILLEASPIDDADCIPVAGLRIDGSRLHVEAMSEPRLDHAVQIVIEDFGDLLIELSSREVVSFGGEDEPEAAAVANAGSPPDISPAVARRWLRSSMTERMRRWIDEPHPGLDGQTPREAAAEGRQGEVLRLLRGLENAAERARRDGEPSADVAWLRTELGVADDLAA